jgi:TRAP-type C4-dicarboxylate transport system permease small subunit
VAATGTEPADPGEGAADARAFLRRLARPFAWLGAVAVVYMVAVTTVAVVARKLTGWEPPGMQEQMELALAIAIFGALPGAFLRDEHVVIDLVDGLGRRRLTALLRVLALMLALGFLAFAIWHLVPPFLLKFGSPQTTGMLSIPKLWYGVPVVFGVGFSVAAVAIVLAATLAGRLSAGPTRHLD